jgi:hypothetical protein
LSRHHTAYIDYVLSRDKKLKAIFQFQPHTLFGHFPMTPGIELALASTLLFTLRKGAGLAAALAALASLAYGSAP